jgi:hypothetical protein
MKTKQTIFCGLIAVILALTFIACDDGGTDPDTGDGTDPDTGGSTITYSVAANRAANTTAINFTFSDLVSGLTANDITVTNGTGSVTKGALSGSSTSWSLAVTVITAGNVTVSINKTGIERESKTAAVYKEAGTRQVVTIAMWDSYGDGWNSGAALRINVNGTNSAANARLIDGGGPGYYTFDVETFDVVRIYWMNGSIFDYECAFAVYYSGNPPNPMFDPSTGTTDSSKVLVSKQYDNPAGRVGDGTLMGTFTVGGGGGVHAHEWHWAPTFIGVDKEVCSVCFTESGYTRAGNSLPITAAAEWSEALSQLNGKNGSYTLNIGGSFAVAGTTAAAFGTTASGSTLTVTLNGNGAISLSSNGSLLHLGARQTLIIDGYLTLRGKSDNNTSVIDVGSDAVLQLRNGTISGNTASFGGGVNVSNGTFTMSGGNINGNTSSSGGGVYVSGGTFTMSGGRISGNTASLFGGGVCVYGTFTMSNGVIGDSFSNTGGNTASNGGGVFCGSSGTFTMSRGNISGNTASSFGGGVHVLNGTFTMNGEDYLDTAITGNTASNGGGVYLSSGTFRMVTGLIFGSELSSSTSNNANSGSALHVLSSATAQYGTLSGSTFNRLGDLSTTNDTLVYKDGVSSF